LSKKEISICRKKVQIENPSPFARKELAYFYAPLRCTPLRFKKANTFPPALIFAREQKCIINHSGLDFCAGMVVPNTTKALEKFFINVFPLKAFLNWKNYLNSKVDSLSTYFIKNKL
jgi:hypothetical protein